MRALPDGTDVELGEIVERFGSRTHGTAILILSVPDAIPLPIPSVGAILGVPLILISLHLALFGEAGGVPARARRWRLPAAAIGVTKRYVVPVLTRAERISAVRVGAIAGRGRIIGLLCLLLSLILLLPIPLMNTPPSLCLAVLAWGMIQRDGVFVLAGMAATAALIASLGFAVEWAVEVIT